jgi:hypothetical protein
VAGSTEDKTGTGALVAVAVALEEERFLRIPFGRLGGLVEGIWRGAAGDSIAIRGFGGFL